MRASLGRSDPFSIRSGQMQLTRALIALALTLSADRLGAQYIVPAASPLASGVMPPAMLPPRPASAEHEVASAIRNGVSIDVSLVKHVTIGAAVGGVAGYFIGGAMGGDGGYPYRGEDIARIYGVAAGLAAGAIIGTVVWGVRRTEKSARPAQPPAASPLDLPRS
jgi:hypothetical protein